MTNPQRHTLPLSLLLLGILALFFLADGFVHLNDGPAYAHSWRQGDSAAQYLNYYQNNEPFIKPRTLNLQLTSEARVVSEFPVAYWLSAKFAQVFGFQMAWLRGLHYLILLGGLIGLYLLINLIVGNKWLSILPPLFYASSPLMMFFGPNPMPNVPAIGLVLMSWYFFWNYLCGNGKNHQLLWLGITLGLAMVIKPSEGIHYVAMLLVLVIGRLFFQSEINYQWSAKRLGAELSVFAVVIAAFFLWLRYVSYYNGFYGNNANLQGILPIWDFTQEQINFTWRSITVHHFKDVGGRNAWWVMIVMAITLLVNPKAYRYFFTWAFLVLLAGTMAYLLLFYQALLLHNYYLITATPLLVFLSIAWLNVYKEQLTGAKVKYISMAVVVALLLDSSLHLRHQLEKFYQLPQEDFLTKSHFTLAPALRAMGVPRDARIVSIPDPTPNVSLYYANNPGWTDYLLNKHNPEIMSILYLSGARYLVCSDPEVIKHNPSILEAVGPPIGNHERIVVYPILPPAEGE